ncbi:helix-turn-helix domain-containing protein [Mucilaginibacter kameinonensis]|uniref:helix-turn-helix domain-containing protein n=1 Tax=Mucilaginibacter kameinonensis TaxID=452286 RepID=UPI000EF7C912|nr:helix-turn-helix transcriptional regulator [Mucilaginibacter kameinonensis]
MGIKQDSKGILLVGTNVRKYRTLLNLSVRDLANLLETDHSQINRIELGKVNTSIGIIFAIAEALKVEPFKLFLEDKPAKDTKALKKI